MSREYTVLDLFSGAGGMAVGFEAAGARTVGAVELDARSGETFASNLEHGKATVLAGPEEGDLTRLEPAEVLARLPAAPSLIIGGPPCQGFSRVGRAKQASLLSAEEKTRQGGVREPDRNVLYRRFLAFVDEAKPEAFVMENVPGMRETLGVDVAGRIAREAAHLGYNVRYFLLNASWYGVPQHRWRIFFVGIRTDLGVRAIPKPPPCTHEAAISMPEGTTIPEDPWMIWGEAIPEAERLAPPVTVREAIGDLPRLRGHLKGVRPEDRPMSFGKNASRWAKTLNQTLGWKQPDRVTGNWYRFTPRDFPIFREMAHGDCYPEALKIATRRFREEVERRKDSGALPDRPSEEALATLKGEIVPPYRNDAFDEKWRKLAPDRPSWVLTAHLSRDTYSHIHYQSSQARTITVREAARLQSFPDSFEFKGNFGDQFRQIGNAVPPLLAKAIAVNLFMQLDALRAAEIASEPRTAVTAS
jgi:DNA (cytosine-5)-methyltransferase 1